MSVVAPQRTRIKICGLTRPADVEAAAVAGADAIGVVLTTRSKRHVTLAQARIVLTTAPPLVTRVALFMNPTTDEVRAALNELPLDVLQFHGDESPAFCAAFQRPYWKAIAMGAAEAVDSSTALQIWKGAAGLLFDAHRPGESGGQGEVFDWSLLPRSAPAPVILAGGLNPANVAQAVRQVRPYAVDVSSGVEIAPGIKDHALLRHFVEEVRRGDAG